MKKLMLMLIMVFIVVLSSCEKYINPDKEGNKNSDKLIQYLSDKDVDGLKEMFCKTVSLKGNLDKQIQEAMYLFEGKVTSYELPASSGGGRKIRDGNTIQLNISPHITNIITDTGRTYEIKYYSYLINAEDEDKVDISELSIISADGSECVVGEFIK